jgi:bifunctional non-homologous end joining protein LigD
MAKSPGKKRQPPAGLREYWRKRDFKRTSEPAGRVGQSEGFSFVIQKHHASRLHYDFRLELGGVLKSWAVPKGPSLNPKDRRLAAHVEDHPLDYAGFEGVIPEGEYGGGKVIVWDRGTWEPVGDPYDGYRKGRLKFRLSGVKLRGGWNLVRMAPRDPAGKENNWLLIKERDEHAGEADITEERPDSVLREAGPPRVWLSDRGKPAPPKARRRPSGRVPEIVEPELATLVEKPPEGDDWLHEIKFDGYRILCRVDGVDVRLSTRHGKDWTDRFPSLVAAARQLRVKDVVLDGEVVILDSRGVSDFQALQNALGKGREKSIVYFAFDLLYLDGTDLRGEPLVERKKALEKLLRKSPEAIKFTEHVAGKGKEFLKKACDFALEGIVSKRASARYKPGRTEDWLKTKCLDRQEFVIGGFTSPEGSRSAFGSLILGVHDRDGRLAYAGRVGTGFSEDTLRDLHARLTALERTSCPFEPAPPRVDARKLHWVEPKLIAEVAYSGWTSDRVLRHPRFEGLREDKSAGEVVLERPRPAPGTSGNVRLTHPERIMYPDPGLTKRELAEFYASIADRILPHVVGRPLSILRCPQGQDKECFYQKHAHAGTPDVVKRVRIREGTGTVEGTGVYVYIDGLDGLISLVQMGVLEVHPWGSRVDALETPDRLILDLDPAPDVPWTEVVETAQALHARLEELGLRSFVKTTGGKGLHVVAPVLPTLSWEEMKEFSRAICQQFVRAAPDRFVATMTKSKREGKIFLDFFRNTRGATAVAAYSTRARAGAPVSTPLTWKELDRFDPSAPYTVTTLPKRLARLPRDPWEGFLELRQSITPAALRQVIVK